MTLKFTFGFDSKLKRPCK